MRALSIGVFGFGVLAWAGLVVWHLIIVMSFGWPAAWVGIVLMAAPGIALAFYATTALFPRWRQGKWGLLLSSVSLGLAGALIYAEVSMRFAGYK
jgi:hypothetical protein